MKAKLNFQEYQDVRDFAEGTEPWYEALHDDIKDQSRGGCVLCGVIPKKLLNVARALKKLL